MARQSHRRGSLSDLLRFYRFALKHWGWILLVFFGMFLYAGVSFNALLLIKPLVESMQEEQGAAVLPDGPVADTAVDAQPPETDEAPPEPLADADAYMDNLKERAKQWVLNLPVVRSIARWLLPPGNRALGMKRLALFLGLVLAPAFVIATLIKDYAAGRVTWTITADVRVALFERLMTLSLSFFSGQRRGELISRLTNDIQMMNKALKILFGKILLEPLLLLALLGVAAISSWQLTVIAIVTVPLMVGASTWMGKRIRRYGRKTLQRLADVTDSISQMLAGVRVVKSFNMEAAECEDFRERNEAQLRKAYKLVRNRALGSAMPAFFMTLPLVLMLLVANYLIEHGDLDFENMIRWLAAVGMMGGPVKRIVAGYNDLQESMAGVTRVMELIDTEPVIQDAPDAVPLGGIRDAVRFENVWFSYDPAEPILRGIDLEVPVGKVYAIVGETGAGKSTMLDLIPRFYDVTDGRVTIDGLDVRQITRESLMRGIAIVGQHPFLFNRTIAENIRYGKPGATDEEIQAAASAANIHEFIESLPAGYETRVGEAGDRLSGGQRQCVTIARAILRDAPILILDEATSSLDAESEAQVQEALGNLMRRRTTFVIAHRLSTIRHADQIVVLKDGVIAERGTHEELLAHGGEYDRLYRFQFGPASAEVVSAAGGTDESEQ